GLQELLERIDWGGVIERVFKEESGRILAGLIRLCRSFDWAEEAMQDAFAIALTTWPAKGVPTNPGAWIMTVAHRRIVDRARRETKRTEYQTALAAHPEQRGAEREDGLEPDAMSTYPDSSTGSGSFRAWPSDDDRLRLMFTCCHPALNLEAQIALTLRTLAGLQTPEIARAFLVSEAT